MTQAPLPLWLEVLRAVAPLLAALLAAGVGAWVAHKFGRIQEAIARQQAQTAAAAAQTARNKLKLELFDRRLEIYKAATDALATAIQSGEFTIQDDKTFLNGIRGARWVLSPDLQRYLHEDLWSALTNLHVANSDLKSQLDEPQRAELARHRAEAFRKVREQWGRIEEIFAPYLQLES